MSGYGVFLKAEEGHQWESPAFFYLLLRLGKGGKRQKCLNLLECFRVFMRN